MVIIERVAAHVRGVLGSPGQQTVEAYPSLQAGPPLVCVDAAPGARLPLELMSRSRVAEVSSASVRVEPLNFGGPTPRSWDIKGLAVRTRYEPGPDESRAAAGAVSDAMAICHALTVSDWASVPGLRALSARPGQAKKVTVSDDAGRKYTSIICEVEIAASVDTGV